MEKIIYNLMKTLKEAGLPQEGKGEYIWSIIPRDNEDHGGENVYIPTPEELKEFLNK
jgi:hypothetical protein